MPNILCKVTCFKHCGAVVFASGLLLGCVESTADRGNASTTEEPWAEAGTRMEADVKGRRRPISRIDATIPKGQHCVATTVLACDGADDCPQDEVCCGAFDFQRRAYGATQCQPGCDPMLAELEFCQPGDACRGGGIDNAVCRRSFVLPEPYLICTAPSPTAPATSDDLQQPAAGQVACGEGQCIAGQACCVRTSFDYDSRTDSWPTAYCVDNEADCTCSGEAPTNTLSAGLDGGVQPQDAAMDGASPDVGAGEQAQ